MSEINLVIAVGAFGIPRARALWKANPKPKLVRAVHEMPKPQAAPEPGPYANENDIPGGMVNGLANPVTGSGATPAEAKTPSQMWNQPGDIEDAD